MKSNIVIVVIAIVAAAGAAYFAYDFGHKAGVAEAMDVRNGFFQDAQRFPAAAAATPGAGQRTGGQGGNPATALFGGVQGIVDKIDGNTLTVTVTRGQQTQQVKVTIADGTTVQNFAPGTLSDVKVGARILVGTDRPQGQGGGAQPPQGQAGQGQQPQGQSGQFQPAAIPSEVTARSITILPTSFGQ